MAILSPDLKLMLLAFGESGVFGFNDWGEIQNANLGFIEQALTETSEIAVTSADITLDDNQQRSLYLKLSGTLTGNREIVLKADQDGFWFVTNGTSGAYTVTLKPSGGTGVTVRQGAGAIIVSDGSEAFKIIESENLSAFLTTDDIGDTVQPHDVLLDEISDLAVIAGDLIVGSGSNELAVLAKGSNGEVLTMVDGNLDWAPPAASGITAADARRIVQKYSLIV